MLAYLQLFPGVQLTWQFLFQVLVVLVAVAIGCDQCACLGVAWKSLVGVQRASPRLLHIPMFCRKQKVPH